MKERFAWSFVCIALLLGWSVCIGAEDSPYIMYVYPAGGQQGTTFEATIGGLNILDSSRVRLTGIGITTKILGATKPKPDTKKVRTQTGDLELEFVRVSVTIAAKAKLGKRDLRLVTPKGVTNRFRFFVGELAEVREAEDNDEKDEAQKIESLPILVNGQVMSGDTDCFRFSARAGKTIVCRVEARSVLPYIADGVPGWFQATLGLFDGSGKELQYVDDFRFDPDPVIIHKVERDGDFILAIKDSLYRGREDFIYRMSIGELPFITHIYPLGGQRNSKSQAELHGVNLGQNSMEVSVPLRSGPVQKVGLVSNGLTSNSVDYAVDRRPKTDEKEPNPWVDKANEIKPPVIVNGRIDKPGDADYFAFDGKANQRIFVEVLARRLGSPLDSVITILNKQGRELKENDDTVDKGSGLVTHHADSLLDYKIPSDGKYYLRIRDVQGKGGQEYAYRLVVSPPWQDFDLRIMPDNPVVTKGGVTVIRAYALRKEGFAGEIKLAVEGLPNGFVVDGAVIPAGQDEVRFTISASADAGVGIVVPGIKGTAVIGGKEVTRRGVIAEELMQAFLYTHFVPTEEWLLTVVEGIAYSLSHDMEGGKVVEVVQGKSFQVNVKAVRGEEAKGNITISGDEPPNGLTVKRATIAADKNEGTVTVTASRSLKVGFEQNVILEGTTKVGKESIKFGMGAISIRVIAEPKK